MNTIDMATKDSPVHINAVAYGAPRALTRSSSALSLLALGAIVQSAVPLVASTGSFTFRLMTPALVLYAAVAAGSFFYAQLQSMRRVKPDTGNDLLHIGAWLMVTVHTAKWTTNWANSSDLATFVEMYTRNGVPAAVHYINMAACSYALVAFGCCAVGVNALSYVRVHASFLRR